MFEQLDELITARQAAEKEFQEKGGNLVKETLKKFLEENPAILALHWRQYTPYFNDGEPCYFRVGEIEAQVEEDGDFVDGWSLRKTQPELETKLEEIQSRLHKSKGLLESVFGEHSKVTVSREKITIDDYSDHD